MKYSIKNDKYKIMLSQMISYMLIFALSFVIMIGMCFYLVGRIESEMLKEAELQTENANRELDRLFEEATSVRDQLYFDDDIQRFSLYETPLSLTARENIRTIDENFVKFNEITPSVYKTYLYYTNSNVFFSEDGSSAKADLLYNSRINYPNMNFADFVLRLRQSSAHNQIWAEQSIVDNDISVEVISYVSPIFDVSAEYANAFAVILIDSGSVSDIFGSVMGLSSYGIISSSGEVLFQRGDIPIDHLDFYDDKFNSEIYHYNGERIILNELNNNLVAYYQINSSSVTSAIREVISILSVVFIVFLVIMLVIIIAIATRRVSAIQNIFTQLNLSSAYKNIFTSEYKIIDMGIQELKNRQEQFENELKSQKHKLEIAIYERLFTSKKNNIDEIKSEMAELGIIIASRFYRIIIIAVNDTIALDNHTNNLPLGAGVVLENFVGENFISPAMVYYKTPTRVCILLCSDDADKLNISITSTSKNIEKLQGGAKLQMGISSQFEDFDDFQQHYIAAKQSVTYGIIWNENVMEYKNIASEHELVMFSVNETNKLLWFMHNNKKTQITKTVNAILERNKAYLSSDNSEKNMLISYFMQIVYQYNASYNKSANLKSAYININGNISKVLLEYDFNKISDIISQSIFRAMEGTTTKIAANDEDAENALVLEINKYIKDNFSNFDLGLSVLSKKFQLTEKYLSKMYKDKTGENLSYYIQEYRLQGAFKMIMETNESLKNIIYKSGYNNENTFYKAFKRRFGVTPKQCRESQK